MVTKDEMPACPVATTVSLIGSKWKLLIMRNLLARPWRFNELKKDLEGISQKVLTDSLRSMEEDGIIIRTVYAEVPPRVEYSLSELGESMRPIIKSMEEWGISYKTISSSISFRHRKILKSLWLFRFPYKMFLYLHSVISAVAFYKYLFCRKRDCEKKSVNKILL